MGLFYTTFTTFGPGNSAVSEALKKLGRTAFVSPTFDEYTVIYDRSTEEQDFAEIEKFGVALSNVLAGPVIAAVLHDDDVLYLWLFQSGEQRDFYDSLPQYFDPDAEPGPPEGGDSQLLCQTYGRSRHTKRVEKLLRANLLEEGIAEIPGELERHQALLMELGMPACAAAVTFSSIDGEYLPEEFRMITFTRVREE